MDTQDQSWEDTLLDYGRRIFNAEVAPRLQKHDEGCVVLIDLDSGAWEVSQQYRDGLDKLTNRNPLARVWYKTIPIVPDELDQEQQSLVRRIGGRPDLAFQAYIDRSTIRPSLP